MTFTALVLTYDPPRICTENMILQYERFLGPDALRFLVPAQTDRTLSPRIRSEVTFVPCDGAIPATVAALLDAVDSREMIYWCIDDKYPVDMDVAAFRAAAAFLHGDPGPDGLSLAMARRLAKGGGLLRRKQRFRGLPGRAFHRRSNFNQFWLHQFMRAACVRHVFDRFPRHVRAAKEMDAHLDAIADNPFEMYVAQENGMVFGESATRGALVPDMVATAKANGLEVPPDRAVAKGESIRIGKMGQRVRFPSRWFGG